MSYDNPMGLDGFEFVEFSAPRHNQLEPVFEMLGFRRVAIHRSKDVHLWRQGSINFIVKFIVHGVVTIQLITAPDIKLSILP